MARFKFDIPLNNDDASRFLPWIIVFMVYLAALFLAGGMMLGTAIDRWDRGLQNKISIEIPHQPPAETNSRESKGDKEAMAAVGKVLTILERTPGIAKAEALGNDAVARLLEPWLGHYAAYDELPLPRLIAVTLEDGSNIDLDALQSMLDEAVPGVIVDNHRAWIDELISTARWVQMVILVIFALIGAVTITTIGFVARTGLAIHADVVDVLHVIGARDTYIARQFQIHGFLVALRGSLIGMGLALATLGGLRLVAGRLDAAMLPQLTLTLSQWVILLSLPLATILVAMLTARIAVLRSLARIP